MNLRGIHIVIFVVLVAAGLVIYGAIRSPKDAQPQAPATAGSPVSQQPTRPEAATEPEATTATGVTPAGKPAVIASLKPKTDAPGKAPVLVVTPSGILDVGIIPGDGIANREFKLTNTGDAVLEIAKVSSACGCVKASIKLEDKKIPPGGESTVKVAINPKAIHGFETRKRITIMSNDAANPRATLDVIAKVDPEFEIVPAKIEFGEIRKGKTHEKTMVFRQLTEERVELKEIKPYANASESVEFSFAERPQDQWLRPDRTEYTITARVREDVSPGKLSIRFALHTTCKRLETLNATVTAKVESFYTIVPSRPPMVRNYPARGGQRATQIIITADRPFEILDIVSSNEDLLITQKLGPAENSRMLALELKKDAKPGRRNDNIAFLIKSAEETLKERITVRTYAASAAARARAPRPSPVRLKPAAKGAVKPALPTAARPAAPAGAASPAPVAGGPAAPSTAQ